MKRLYLATLLAAFVGAFFILLHAATDTPRLSFSCVKVEPAEVLNRDGEDRWLVTFCISNVNTSPLAAGEYLFFERQTTGAVECRKSGLWIKDEEAFATPFVYSLRPGEAWLGLLLVPTGTECCRVPITFTRGTLDLPGRVGRLAQRLPFRIQSQFPRGFWRWVGFKQPVPNRSWRKAEITFDVSGVLPSTQPAE